MNSGGSRATEIDALRARLECDHGVAELLARAVARDAEPKDAVLDAWRSVIADFVRANATGPADAPTREDVLVAVLVAVQDADIVDHDAVPEPPALGRFEPAGHWKGWWDDEQYPPAWPHGAHVDRDRLLRALRRLPLRLRTLVVLREAAGLDIATVGRMVGAAPAALSAELDAARLGFVRCVGDEIAGFYEAPA